MKTAEKYYFNWQLCRIKTHNGTFENSCYQKQKEIKYDSNGKLQCNVFMNLLGVTHVVSFPLKSSLKGFYLTHGFPGLKCVANKAILMLLHTYANIFYNSIIKGTVFNGFGYLYLASCLLKSQCAGFTQHSTLIIGRFAG